MFNKSKLNRVALAVAMSVGLSTAAMAQETSSGISGTVVSASGQSVSGATITLFDTRTGSVKTLTSNSDGVFNTRGLRVGGPYILKVEDAQGSRIIEDVFLNLGEPLNLTVKLENSTDVEQITVTGRASAMMTETSGPASFFSAEDLQAQPTVDRDIKDIVALDPRITIDQTNSNAIQCGGANNRFNSLSVDGVQQNDNFGLNSNGYPTERLPFPFDAIDQVSVELAPFDVEYGGFTGCAINAVTRSGTNEIHGSVFYDYTSDSMQGDSVDGSDIDVPDYDESRYGVTLGLPILKDQLFFFGAYEKHDPTEIFEYGPEDGNFANPLNGLTTATLEQIASTAQNQYGYTVGPIASSGAEKEEKVLLKLDWIINDDHRASLTYQNTDGNTVSTTDSDSDGYAFTDHFYQRGNELTTWSAQLFSTWTNDFETEMRLGHLKIKNGQRSFTDNPDFGEFLIEDVNGYEVHFGADEYRQSNVLNYDTTSAKFAGTYYTGDHTILGGIEYGSTDVFNLFNPGSEGLFTFATLEDFEAGLAQEIEWSIPGSLDTNDAAASFTFENMAVYLQDKWYVTPDLSVTFGLRYDSWSSDDAPDANSRFEQRYGFTNGTKPDFDLLQPRFNFNYNVDDSTFVYGGVGLFAGGNPNVWLSNNYSNDGMRILSTTVTRGEGNTAAELAALDASNTANFGYEVPGYLETQLVGGDGAVNALDPDFEVPSVWKFNVGIQKELGYEVLVGADVIYSKLKNTAKTIALNAIDTGERSADGRIIYTNADMLDPACIADVNSADCSSRSATDFLLTNSDEDGDSFVGSFFVKKDFEFGLSTNFSYAYTDAEEGSPMTSSTASSNYGNQSVVDYNEPGVATSNYETKHRFVLNLTYSTELFEGYASRFTIFAQRVAGKPYSYNFDYDPGFGDQTPWEDRSLLYVPLENDPIVSYGEGFDLEAFNAFVAENGLERGRIQERNEQNSDWWSRVDFKFTQEVPGLMDGHKGEIFFNIRNLGNLLNDEWGVYRQVNFEYNNPVVDASLLDDGTYLYTNFDGDQGQRINQDSSLWFMRIGVRYTF
ncbi:TonB-dependent receptor [Alteromonas confluentis]|uniref:TonB-dependent receptor n=1 Tax=Alteromonas confluentis TaxID=1656094 RepID=A0A1E7ZB81_9ALTE|nr:TonB-dependent receptor [Alteromonas confluentis]OFC70769.1 hypothetical protein BFC18_11570 [Alteromonas confluentis]